MLPQFLLCLVISSMRELQPTPACVVPSLYIHSCSLTSSLSSLKGPGMWSSRVTCSPAMASSMLAWWWWPKWRARPQAAQFFSLRSDLCFDHLLLYLLPFSFFFLLQNFLYNFLKSYLKIEFLAFY